MGYKTKNKPNKTNSQTQIIAMWLLEGKGVGGRRKRLKGVKCMTMKEDWTSGGEHTMQDPEGVL